MYMDCYADAIRPEQIEQAICVAVVTRLKRPHMPLKDCVELAVDQVFCPCISLHQDEDKMSSMSIRTGIVSSIVEDLRQGICTARAGCDGQRIEREVHEVAEQRRRRDEALDDALAQTFPASDPVAVSILP